LLRTDRISENVEVSSYNEASRIISVTGRPDLSSSKLQQMTIKMVYVWSLTSNLTQPGSLRRRSSQPITWLILTNKTVQGNTQTKYNSDTQTTQNTAKQNYHGSVAS